MSSIASISWRKNLVNGTSILPSIIRDQAKTGACSSFCLWNALTARVNKLFLEKTGELPSPPSFDHLFTNTHDQTNLVTNLDFMRNHGVYSDDFVAGKAKPGVPVLYKVKNYEEVYFPEFKQFQEELIEGPYCGILCISESYDPMLVPVYRGGGPRKVMQLNDGSFQALRHGVCVVGAMGSPDGSIGADDEPLIEYMESCGPTAVNGGFPMAVPEVFCMLLKFDVEAV